jgi:hypothetical protein
MASHHGKCKRNQCQGIKTKGHGELFIKLLLEQLNMLNEISYDHHIVNIDNQHEHEITNNHHIEVKI